MVSPELNEPLDETWLCFENTPQPRRRFGAEDLLDCRRRRLRRLFRFCRRRCARRPGGLFQTRGLNRHIRRKALQPLLLLIRKKDFQRDRRARFERRYAGLLQLRPEKTARVRGGSGEIPAAP